MDEEITNWKNLYQQQEISMNTLSIELTRVRGRDRRRYAIEGLATLLLVGVAVIYMAVGTFSFVFTGVGILLFVAISVGFAMRLGRIQGASFAVPKDYISELEGRNDRETRRVAPTWYLWMAGALCVASNSVALSTAWDAYVARPWVMVVAVLGEAALLGAVALWRHREVRRLDAERVAIAELRAQFE